MNVTTQVFILFLVMFTGILGRRLGYLTNEAIRGITRFVINITLPCLLLTNMQRPFSREVFFGFLVTLLLASLLTVLCLAGGWYGFSRREHARRVVLAHCMAFSNSGFMGYPIIMAVNPDWMMYAVAYNIGFNIIFWFIAIRLYGRGAGGGRAAKAFLNPNLVSALIGFFVFCLQLRWPEILSRSLTMVGDLTTPLTMVLIGTRVYGIRLRDLAGDRDYPLCALLRLVALPLAVRLLLLPLPLSEGVSGTLFLLTAMPIATLIPMEAELSGGDVTFAAREAALSTLLSLVTIPAVALLL